MFNSNYIDISLPIDERITVWPSSAKVKFNKLKCFSCGDRSVDHEYHGNLHVGTHIDAPSHFVANAKTIEAIELSLFWGPAFVVEVSPNNNRISAADFKATDLPKGINKLLIKTPNSELWNNPHHEFHRDFVALDPDGAQWIVDSGIDLVGIDYLSIQKYGDSPDVHHILLRNEVVVLEGVDLRKAKQGEYFLMCLPTNMRGVEAAPARAVLFPKMP